MGGTMSVSALWDTRKCYLGSIYKLSLKKLTGLLQRLRQTPDIFHQYDAVIRDQLQKGTVMIVRLKIGRLIYYLPHHPVVREDKLTTKLRILYDASARIDGPSLSDDDLYTGPKFGQSIIDILLRFRAHKIALAADIGKDRCYFQ